MVCEFGMSSLGNRVYKTDQYGDVHPLVEREIKKIIDMCYRDTKAIITSNRDYLERIANELKANETITGTELDAICNF